MGQKKTMFLKQCGAAVLLWAAASLGFSQNTFVLDNGHMDVRISYDEVLDEWDLFVFSGQFGGAGSVYSAEEVLLVASPDTRVSIPAGNTFLESIYDFISESRPIRPWWNLPQSATASGDLLEPGIHAGGIASGVFIGQSATGRVRLELVDFQGPGNFFLYQNDGFSGIPLPLNMDTRSGSAPFGHIEIGAGAHAHYNWDFTEQGIYLLTFQASGELVSGGSSSSQPVTFVFLVEPDGVDLWKAANYYTEATAAGLDDAADADRDGLSVLHEMLFGGNALVSDPGAIKPSLSINRVNGEFIGSDYEFRIDNIVSGLEYRVRYSSNLNEWFDVPSENIQEISGPDPDFTYFRASMPTVEGGLFFTIEVERAGP